MASDYNLKRQIAAHHQELGGAHRITMGGRTLSMNKSGVAEEFIQMLPEKDKEILRKHILTEIESVLGPVDLSLNDFDKVPEFMKSIVKAETEKPKKEVKPKEITTAAKKKIYTKTELEKMTFAELKVIGKEFGTTDRSKVSLIKEILKIQGE